MGTTRTNFYKNPSFVYNRDFNLSSALQNLKAYNLATGNAPVNDDEATPAKNEPKLRRRRRRETKPLREPIARSSESDAPMSHEGYIAKRRKEASLVPAYEELTPDILGPSTSGLNLVGYESDESASESEEKLEPSVPGYVNEGYQSGPEQDRVKTRSEQRYPDPGDPICVMCGKYGEYICDETDDDICSLECKEKLLKILNSKEVLLTHQNPTINLPEHESSPVLVEGEDTWDYDRHRWSRKKSDLCTYHCSKCQKPGHLAEDCLVEATHGRSNSIPRDLLELYKRCRQIEESSRGRCNECQEPFSLATCLDCNVTICDGAGHLKEHIGSHLSHRQYYSHKLKRLVKCCKSTCKVTNISELLACQCCFDKAYDKFYDMVTARWKASGLAIIWGSICCEDHFSWHQMNCPNAGVEESAYIIGRNSGRRKQIQISEFIF